MRKSFILLTMCALAGLWSCQSRIEDETSITYASDESEVEITVAADRTPRNVPSATPDENIIDNLDILLFDSNGKFICWRATFKINGKLRTTLPVGKDYDAYFLANCRSFIGKMLPDKATEKQYRQQADWEVFRKTLVDANPQRLLQENTAFTSLPMWGMLKKQDVNDRVINYWPLLSLTRSVASVDVYVANGIDYFILKDITLFHVPDKGFLGNAPANVWNRTATTAPTVPLPTSFICTTTIRRTKLQTRSIPASSSEPNTKERKAITPLILKIPMQTSSSKSYGTRSTYSISILPTVRDIRIRKQPPASLPSISMSTS